MDAAKTIIILLVLLAIGVVTWVIIWALATISLYIGIPFVLLLAIFVIVLFLKVAGNA